MIDDFTLDKTKHDFIKKKKWLGLVLNFLMPGLGNIYARNIGKGIFYLILFWLFVIGARFVAYTFTLLLIAYAIVFGFRYLFLLISGYRSVQKDKVYEPEDYDKWYIYVLAIVMHWTIASFVVVHLVENHTPISYASIPTPAMEPTLQVGDKLAYEKTRDIARNDVTLFWFPNDTTTMYVKRCMGLPGDSLQIKEGHVYLNGRLSSYVPVKMTYAVITKGEELPPDFLKQYNIESEGFSGGHIDRFYLNITSDQAGALAKSTLIKSVEPAVMPEGQGQRDIYPQSPDLDWNTDFYGPIYIPKKGDKIQLTKENFNLYRKCIESENSSVGINRSEFEINGKVVTVYEFKESYYFVMGDNRHNSSDSRYWGLLPEKRVIGKALYLFWSRKKERIGKEVV